MHLYRETARILRQLKEKKGAVKTLVFSSRFHNKRKLYALVCETLKFNQIFSSILKRTKLQKKLTSYEEKQYLLIVLAYEFFVGQGLDRTKAVAKQFFKHLNVIQREYDKLLAERNVSTLSDLIPNQGNVVSLPRYVRVNLLKTTVERVVDQLRKEGWKLKKQNKSGGHIEDFENLGTREFLHDPHLSDVLVFPHGTELHKHKMCSSGEIILQDKASCFPAHVLNPPEGSVVIDCCAAPGNKTSHVASLLHNTGKIFAFDKDASRLKTMDKMLSVAGVTNTETTCQDFLTVDPLDEKYSAVEYIIVDPSCSGSGIVGRLDHLVDNEKSSSARLKSLSNFQVTVLKHALSFPNVKRVAYSTCSVHAQENEAVVEEIIQHMGQDFYLRKTFPDWSNRGVEGYKHSQMCLRMSPDQDLTNGFFVACFERKDNRFGNGIVENVMSKSECENCVFSGLTRKEKRKLKKRAKKMKLREEKISNFCDQPEKIELMKGSNFSDSQTDKTKMMKGSNFTDSQSEKKKTRKRLQTFESSYSITEMPDVVRVDNSSSRSKHRQSVFKNFDRDRLSSVGSSFVRMFHKWKVDFTVKGSKQCCIVECCPLNGKRILKEAAAGKRVVLKRTHIDGTKASLNPKKKELTAAERKKMKKRMRKLKKEERS